MGGVDGGQFGVGDEGGVGVDADGTVGSDEVVRLEPVFAVEDVARQVVHEVDDPDGFVFCAVAGLVFGAGCDAHGEFEAPAAVFGVGAFGVEVESAHAVGDEVAVEGLFVAVVDAGAVQRVFATGGVFDDAGVVARLKVAIEGFEGRSMASQPTASSSSYWARYCSSVMGFLRWVWFYSDTLKVLHKEQC